MVISPDDGHKLTRNMSRKEINILRKTVHQVGFIYKTPVTVRSTNDLSKALQHMNNQPA
jgi:hypothetical protein